MGPQPQLERIGVELAEARRRAHEIARPLTAELWNARPAVDQWSVAECVVHLNLTSRAFLPLIRDAISKGRDLKLVGTGPFRRDIIGWLVYWITDPPVRFRVKTTAAFVPAEAEPKDRVLGDFDMLQDQVAGYVREADGLDLGRLRIISPFDSRLKYNLYSCMRIIPAHQRQHLLQAEQVVRSLRLLGRSG